MIWGRTKEEQWMIREKWKQNHEKETLWFAWRPVRLKDGRWVWWQTVRRRYYNPDEKY